MATRNIVLDSDPLLRTKSKPVKEFDEKLWQLLDDMYETMKQNYGAGIAAPQVGILKRVFIVDVNNLKFEFINPEITNMEGKCSDVEGCLSVKGIQGYVNRPTKITIKGYDRFENEYSLTATNWLARAICHEYDHLNGIVFTDIMTEQYIQKPKEYKTKKNKIKI